MPTRSRIKLIMVLTCAGIAHASTIDISLTSPVAAVPGTTVTFNGVLTNTTASTVFLNGASINLAGFPPANLDPSPFYANAPISMDGVTSTANIGLFSVTVPSPFASGPYAGTLTLVGGASDASQTNLGTASFTVQVGSTTAAIPEPASAALLAIGAACLLLRRQKRN